MPLYDYSCRNGHTVEERRGYDDDIILCPLCGDTAQRHAVYRYQSTITETGGKSYPKYNAKDGDKYRVSDFHEASAEIDYAAAQAERKEGKPVKVPSMYKAGLRKAKRMGAKSTRVVGR
jgi:putative FmdB family regulatory protein